MSSYSNLVAQLEKRDQEIARLQQLLFSQRSDIEDKVRRLQESLDLSQDRNRELQEQLDVQTADYQRRVQALRSRNEVLGKSVSGGDITDEELAQAGLTRAQVVSRVTPQASRPATPTGATRTVTMASPRPVSVGRSRSAGRPGSAGTINGRRPPVAQEQGALAMVDGQPPLNFESLVRSFLQRIQSDVNSAVSEINSYAHVARELRENLANVTASTIMEFDNALSALSESQLRAILTDVLAGNALQIAETSIAEAINAQGPEAFGAQLNALSSLAMLASKLLTFNNHD